MKLNFILLSCFVYNVSIGQSITLMDHVKIKDGKRAEAMYFYENNWKIYRDSALKSKIIVSYRLMEVMPDSTNEYDLILMTEYADSAALANSEKNFEGILKKLRPNGPVLLNAVKPADFRKNVFIKRARSMFKS